MSEASFVIPLWADLMAVAVGGVQGALVASGYRDRRLDLLGVAIVGLATALGGGLLRDILLVTPPVALKTDAYLLTALASSLVGMLLGGLFSRVGALLTGLDALTIGLFGAIGASKALAFGLPPVPAVFVGTVSAVGGSILRDVLLATPIALMQVGSLYAVAAGVGSAVLVVLAAFGVPVPIAAIAGVSITTVIRLLAVRFGWRLPEQRRLSRWPRIGLARSSGRGAARRSGAASGTRSRTAERVGTDTGTYRIPRG